MIVSIFISTIKRMRSWVSFQKYEGIRLTKPNSMRFAVQNGKVVCRVIAGKKMVRKRPSKQKQYFRMSSKKAAAFIKSSGKTFIKFLNS